MKKLGLLIVLCILITAKLVVSTSIEVEINEDIKGEIIHEYQNVSFNVVRFEAEFYNTGSIPYSARARVFVYDENKSVFSGWSQENVLMPGEKKTFYIYWYASSPGEYNSILRFYFGNEMVENEKKVFQVSESLNPEDVFEIKNFRTYDNSVVFDVISKKDVSEAVVIPYGYVPGWIFEQGIVENIKEGLIKTVTINYYPTVWKPADLKLSIIAENGKYFSEKTMKMEKEEGLAKLFYNILDNLKLLLF
jgi:hypothetical protein